MNARVLSICLSFAIFVFILNLVRQEKMTFKYASIWIVMALIAIILSVFDQFLFRISSLLGFELPSNFIFFSCFLGVVFLSLLLTIFLCQQNERNDKIAQKLALLENEVQELKSRDNG